LRPQVVITMNFELTWGASAAVNHADHRAVGATVLDACRDAANRWLFPESGEVWPGVEVVYVAAANEPTHFVDVGSTMDAGVASLQEHRQYLEGLGGDFDPDRFLRQIARASAEGTGCEYAVTFRRYDVG
jgi:LmbE family N-acetylglucosaminyl deacetylase